MNDAEYLMAFFIAGSTLFGRQCDYMGNLSGRTLKCHLVPVNDLMRVMYHLLQ